MGGRASKVGVETYEPINCGNTIVSSSLAKLLATHSDAKPSNSLSSGQGRCTLGMSVNTKEVKIVVDNGAGQMPVQQTTNPPPITKLSIKSMEAVDYSSGNPPLLKSGVKAAALPENVSFVAFNAVEFLVDEGDTQAKLKNVRYTYNGGKDVFPTVSLGIQAGQVVAVHSMPSAAGKRTVLSLLARQMIPSEGFIHYPTNWQVRFVDVFPALFNNTLMFNLRFGQVVEHEDEEVWALCRQFGFNSELIGNGQFMVGKNGSHLSYTDAAMVGVLRAMLSSPDFILLPSTLDIIGERLAKKVMENLLIFVKERKFDCLKTQNALALDDQDKLVILSTRWGAVEELANAVLYFGEPLMVGGGRKPGRQMVELTALDSGCLGGVAAAATPNNQGTT